MAKKENHKGKLLPGHRMGSRYGYEVCSDGAIKLAPGLADQMRTVMDRETGLLNMQQGVVAFVAQELGRTSKERRQWWDVVAADLGIEIAKGSGWSFSSSDGCLRPPNEESKAEPPK